MFKILCIIVPAILLGSKEEVRAVYPQIWTELESLGHRYPNKNEMTTVKSFPIENKEEIRYNKSPNRKNSYGRKNKTPIKILSTSA